MINLLEFKLPEPDTRLVVFGSTVFKLKYKASQQLTNSGKVYKTKHVQSDIQRVTAAILRHILQTGEAVPVKSDSVVIYPGLHPWPVGQGLCFSHGNRRLEAHPDMVLLLVSLLTPTRTLPQPSGGSSLLGKHEAASLEDEPLPLVPAVPSSHLLARKRLRLEGSEVEEGGEPGGRGCRAVHPLAAIGAATATAAMPSGAQPVYRRPPTPEEIVLHTRETKERLHALSQPSEEPGAGQKPVSTLRKTLGIVKSMLRI